MEKIASKISLSKKIFGTGLELAAKTGVKRNKSAQRRLSEDSISRDDESDCLTCADSDSTCTSTIVPLRTPCDRSLPSCFKGSRQSDNKVAKKQVTILQKKSKREKIKYVESFTRYSSELWWNKAELEKTRKEQLDYSNANHQSLKSLGSFLNSYYLLRDQLYQADKSKVSDAIESRNMDSCGFLSKKSYNKLVKGFKKEFNGIERYVGYDCECRRNQVLDHSKMVVGFYNKTISNIDDEKLALYASSLSVKDRCWSYIIGTAQYLAAVEADIKISL